MSKTIIVILVVVICGGALLVQAHLSQTKVGEQMVGKEMIVHATDVDIDAIIREKGLSSIYLAGGCFWGVEEYMARIGGVYDSVSGYANGNTENPSYEDVIYKGTGHAETVQVVYDKEQVSLEELLDKFFKVVDPTSLNKQGNDRGTQYRSGIYYTEDADKIVIDSVIKDLQDKYDEPIVVEVETLQHFYKAEEYHQDYLQKNQGGYCHIDLDLATEDGLIDKNDYHVPEGDLKGVLSELEYHVTQEEGTERAFTSELDKNYEVGIYVDIVTGEPLFLSTDKYDSGTGWPSFTKPIEEDVIVENEQGSFRYGTELKSRSGNSHLGHVFTDGPQDRGGLRYCINGAALRFIPYNSMVNEGYGYLQHLLIEDDAVSLADELNLLQ